jgi:serine/threonine protein kinase
MKKDALLPVLGVSTVKVCKPCGVAVNDVDSKMPRRCFSSTDFSDSTHTVDSVTDMTVSQTDLDDLEALVSPDAVRFDHDMFSGWDVIDLPVRWYPAERIRDVRELSSDDHANVWLVHFQGSKKLVAKRLAKEGRTQQSATDFINDIKLIAKLQHPRIVELVGVSWMRDCDLQVLFEYMPGGDLRSYLDSTASEAAFSHHRKIEKVRIALDIAEGLAYVHSLDQPFHHRALESSNVLLTADNRAKIGGFGGVRVELATKSGGASSEIARWLAPEVLSDSTTYSAACDIYSLGVILTELDTHAMPYSDCYGPQGNILPTVAVLFLVSLGQAKPSMSTDCPPELRQLSDDCLAFEPQQRPSAIEVVARLRSFMRTLGLNDALEASKTAQQLQHKDVVLCDDESLMGMSPLSHVTRDSDL